MAHLSRQGQALSGRVGSTEVHLEGFVSDPRAFGLYEDGLEDFLETIPASPQDRLTTTWGEIKNRRSGWVLSAGMCKRHKTDVLSHSLTDINDETLQSELEKRGYNVTRRRENETTAEIVKLA